MGTFDYIKCEYPLPTTDTPPPAGDTFQTKDTPDQYLTTYTITSDGELVWRPYEMVEVPMEERRYPNGEGLLKWIGALRRVEGPRQTLDFHGDIEFYTGGGPEAGWWEYRARFTEGRLSRIDLVEFTPPEPAND